MFECRRSGVIAIMRKMDCTELSRLRSKVAKKGDRKLRKMDMRNQKKLIPIDNINR